MGMEEASAEVTKKAMEVAEISEISQMEEIAEKAVQENVEYWHSKKGMKEIDEILNQIRSREDIHERVRQFVEKYPETYKEAKATREAEKEVINEQLQQRAMEEWNENKGALYEQFAAQQFKKMGKVEREVVYDNHRMDMMITVEKDSVIRCYDGKELHVKKGDVILAEIKSGTSRYIESRLPEQTDAMLKYKGDLENKGTNVILMVEVPADRITPGLLTLVKDCLLYTSPSPRDRG